MKMHLFDVILKFILIEEDVYCKELWGVVSKSWPDYMRW